LSAISFEDHTRGQLMNAKNNVNTFLDEKMEDYYNRYVIPEIKAIGRAANAPAAFIESFKFVKTGRGRGKIINTLGSKEKPLAKWFNYGTKHNYPITTKVVHPEGTPRVEREKTDVGGGHVLHPETLHYVDASGEHHFPKMVIHPGQPRTLVMEKGVTSGSKQLISIVSDDVKEEFEDE